MKNIQLKNYILSNKRAAELYADDKDRDIWICATAALFDLNYSDAMNIDHKYIDACEAFIKDAFLCNCSAMLESAKIVATLKCELQATDT